MPMYMQRPKAESVAIAALMLPNKPSHGLDLTQSVIIHVTVINIYKYNVYLTPLINYLNYYNRFYLKYSEKKKL